MIKISKKNYKVGDTCKCQCGCNGDIIITESHLHCCRIPKFLYGHHCIGTHLSEERKQYLKEKFTGRSNYWFKGKQVPAEVAIRLRTMNIGKPLSEEHRKSISAGRKGIKFTPEHCANLSKAFTGRKVSLATKQKISKHNSGDKCNFWKGGITNSPYGIEFNLILKEEIRTRDNHKCQKCDTPQIELNKKLMVHHIDYNKCNNSEANLISLCNKCHSKTNSNRKYWEEYFTQVMISKISIGKKE